MADPYLTEILDNVITRCTTAGNPIPGLFFIANQISLNERQSLLCKSAMLSLLEITPSSPDDWLKLHVIEDIERVSKTMGLPAASRAMNAAPKTVTPYGLELDTGIVPEAWSVAGLLFHLNKPAYANAYLDGVRNLQPGGTLPGLKDPLAMPVNEAFVAGGGMDSPVNQWLPAFRAKATQKSLAQVHDLFDQATVLMRATDFLALCKQFSAHAHATPQAKSGYLARQGVHAYDIANHDLHRLEREINPGEVIKQHSCTRFNFPAPTMMGYALMHGAKLPQSAWSGAERNARAFGESPDEVKELVYGVISAGAMMPDTVLAATLRRMREEGHDVVVHHRKHAPFNADTRPENLPLHLCAKFGFTESLVALLEAGADTQSTTHGSYGASTLEQSARQNKKTSEQVMGIVHAFEARHLARALMEEMQSNGPPGTSAKMG